MALHGSDMENNRLGGSRRSKNLKKDDCAVIGRRVNEVGGAYYREKGYSEHFPVSFSYFIY